MAKTRKRSKRGRSGGERLLVAAFAAALVLCGASIAVGVMNWMTRAHGHDVTEDIRIEVLNGTGERGLGRVVARALMKKRIDVLSVGNADKFDYEETILIARTRNAAVEPLGEMLGCGRFIEQLKDDSMVDATLIIGADYRTLNFGLNGVSNLSD